MQADAPAQAEWVATWNDAADTAAQQHAAEVAAGDPLRGGAATWERHFQVAADREWYGAGWSSTLRPALAPVLRTLRRHAPHRALNMAVLGCGSSRVGPEMRAELGWPWPWTRPNVSNYDLSVAAIERMQANFTPPAPHRRRGLHFVAADARALPLSDGSTDFVIDKGTINAIISDRGYRRQERAARREHLLVRTLIGPRARLRRARLCGGLLQQLPLRRAQWALRP